MEDNDRDLMWAHLELAADGGCVASGLYTLAVRGDSVSALLVGLGLIGVGVFMFVRDLRQLP